MLPRSDARDTDTHGATDTSPQSSMLHPWLSTCGMTRNAADTVPRLTVANLQSLVYTCME